ncbi:hypothetical protein [Papillibacter cinnamivorans]|uniref:Uncharacterized protein n=1 Tax=Papillibacter cinnamivorans DSM 12816 TaxID=1122930 RepID=A0A1W1YKQ8_9FIRM|nr:hypothetical protein [Papillibacter cinnamivorans]SMC36391.1 hypothetical protein SAMN02745168_0485 [Papillibacter cinnamivorans DSM 12816]
MAFDTGILQGIFKNPEILKLLQNGSLMNQLGNSPEGKRLLEIMNGGDGTPGNTMEAASKGDLAAMMRVVSALMSNPEAMELVNKLGRELNQNSAG